MIKIHINPEDRYLLRFAFSPSYEIVTSYRVLRDPSRYTLHRPWAVQAQRTLGHMDLSLFNALIPSKGYVPDFLTPLPNSPTPSIEEEIEAMVATPEATVQRDLHRTMEFEPSRREVLLALAAQPKRLQSQLAKLMAAYWRKALAPHWARIRTVLEGDLLTRARSLAMHGPETVLSQLHPLVRYADGALQVDKPYDQEVRTGGDGLMLVPSVFVAPHFLMFVDTPPTPVVIYGARGAGTLWLGDTSAHSAGLQELLGNTRANLLIALESPQTTAQLAARLKLTAGAVSQHLGALKRAGTVETHRQGRSAFHQLTPVGESLVRVFA